MLDPVILQATMEELLMAERLGCLHLLGHEKHAAIQIAQALPEDERLALGFMLPMAAELTPRTIPVIFGTVLTPDNTSLIKEMAGYASVLTQRKPPLRMRILTGEEDSDIVLSSL